MTYIKSISLIFTSLFIFLYTLKYMRTILETKTKASFKNIILRFTNNYHVSFILGILLTIILTSSSALTALILVFLSSKLISKKSALAMLLGSNIGTTITSFIFSFNILNYSFIFIIIGILFFVFNFRFLARFLASVGVLLFSLLVLQTTLSSVSSSISGFISLSPLFSFLEGIIFSMITSSSSSCIITANLLYTLNSIELYQALAIMLGANVGTTVNSLFFIIGMDKDSLHISLINIIYNLLGGLLFLIFIDYFEYLIILLKPFTKNNLLIPLSHLLYNFITTIITYLFFMFYKPKTHNYWL